MTLKTRYAQFQQYLAHDFEADDEQAISDLLAQVLPLIGIVAMQFNALEVELNSAICMGFTDRTDQMGLVVINGMAYLPKVKLFGRMCDALHGVVAKPVPAEYNGLQSTLEEVGQLRNLVLHADWHSMDAQGYTFTRLRIAGGAMQQEYALLTAPALEEVVERIIDARGRLDSYVVQRNALQYT